nr:3-oxoacyl-[acyl-carrier-protein] synthase III C-terminal domain-containing protein [Chitinivibrio alkaliphilus]
MIQRTDPMAIITHVGTANPDFFLSQKDASAIMTQHYRDELSRRGLSVLQQVLEHPAIEKRHMSVTDHGELLTLKNEDPDARMTRFTRWAVGLGKKAIETALEKAGKNKTHIGAIVCNTCTGYVCPGISTYIAEALELPPTIPLFDLVGSGCGGALPNIDLAKRLLSDCADDQVVISLSVEICSATFEMSNDMSLIISNGIFGDGAAAAVLSREGAGFRLGKIYSRYLPQHREKVRFTYKKGRLHNRLDPKLPHIIAQELPPLIEDVLAGTDTTPSDIPYWAVHPGGDKVLTEVRNSLGLEETHMDISRQVLREYGNMSSPSVLFELDRILSQEPACGDECLMTAFGAGLSAFAVKGVYTTAYRG